MYIYTLTDDRGHEIELISIEGDNDLNVIVEHEHTKTGEGCAEAIAEKIFQMIHDAKDEFIHSDTDEMWTEVMDSGEVIVTFSNGVTKASYYIQPEIIKEIVSDELNANYSEIYEEYDEKQREQYDDMDFDFRRGW